MIYEVKANYTAIVLSSDCRRECADPMCDCKFLTNHPGQYIEPGECPNLDALTAHCNGLIQARLRAKVKAKEGCQNDQEKDKKEQK